MDDAHQRGSPRQPGSFLYPRPAIAAAAPPGEAVAIILRTRNRPLLLGRALAGITGQTHAAWHLYVVNDGGDPAAIDALLRRHGSALAGRVSVIHRDAPPHGPWPAAQAGLDAIGREGVVCLHDDDDSWEPGFLAAVTGFLNDPAHAGFVAVSTGCTLIEEEIAGETVTERWRCRWPHGRGLVDLSAALTDAQIPPICLAFRRDALFEAGGFDARLRFAGDWEALLRLLLLGEIGHVDAVLASYHHRVRGSGEAYGNTVVEQQPARREQLILLRNAMLRAGLHGRPETLGLLQALLTAQAEVDPRARLDALVTEIAAARNEAAAARAAAEQAATAAASEQAGRLEALRHDLAALHAGLAARFDRIDADLAELRKVAGWHRTLLRPLRFAWHSALPLRRVVARARGRSADAASLAPDTPPPPPPPLSPRMLRMLDWPVIGPRLLRRELVRRFISHHGRAPELDPPRGFNAHMVARILRDRDPRLKIISDKFAVREVVRAALGDAVLVPLLGAWDDPRTVPWDSLPLPFMMKPSHASGLTHAVTRPDQMQADYLTALACEWLAHDYYESSPEWGYRGIPRRLLIEPLLKGADGGAPLEAQVFTFGGRVTHIRICTGPIRGPGRTNNWFDTRCMPLPISQNYPTGSYRLQPELAERLTTMATVLAANYAHLRVDFLVTADGPRFAELTPYTGAGASKWDPPEVDLEFGRLWDEGAARIAGL
ncbi:ATP-grasp fold amidoligase family protein [Roseomonas sp. CAU 1739]|uniref:ATP-grasp fold amidoligase family protein n=1 Tax=Roseomonas sp. CAU 1739 TaxID=3140364 RepID=UPI00325B4891